MEKPCYGSIKCCDNTVSFSSANSYCEQTCNDVIQNHPTDHVCDEGCRCPPGQVRDANKNCVTPSECYKCSVNGTTWQVGINNREFFDYFN